MIVTKLLDKAWLEKNVGHGVNPDDQHVRSARWILHYRNGNFYRAKKTEISRKCIHVEFRGDCGSLKMKDQPFIVGQGNCPGVEMEHRVKKGQKLPKHNTREELSFLKDVAISSNTMINFILSTKGVRVMLIRQLTHWKINLNTRHRPKILREISSSQDTHKRSVEIRRRVME